MIVAIDGPSGAGKSTVAKAVARKLGFSCLDTGAMYRAIAWKALEEGIDLADAAALGELARTCEIAFEHEGNDPIPRRVFIDGTDVTSVIRTAEIDKAVSPVSATPSVREALVAQQQRIGASGNYVVEGRDIGTTVFPDAACKVFLTASAEERAHRRVRQNVDRDLGRSITKRCLPISSGAMRSIQAVRSRRSSLQKTRFTSIRRIAISKRSSTRSAR